MQLGEAWAAARTTAAPGWRRPSQTSRRQRELLGIAAQQAGAAAAKGGLRQHAGSQIQPGQLAATPGQRRQEEAGAAAQIQPAHCQICANLTVRHPLQQRLPHLLLEAGVGVVVTGGGAETAGKLGLVDRLKTLIEHGCPSLVVRRAGAEGIEQAIHILFTVGRAQGDAQPRRADRHRGRADGAGPDAAFAQPLGQLQGGDALPTSSGWMGVVLAPSCQPSACAPCRKRVISRPSWARASSAARTSSMLWRTAQAWAAGIWVL